jgi:hypothetical protein
VAQPEASPYPETTFGTPSEAAKAKKHHAVARLFSKTFERCVGGSAFSGAASSKTLIGS